MLKYAGIGSRETPSHIIRVMEDYAYCMASHAVLRSGGAPGADVAFEFGASTAGGRKEIYLPWNGFNGALNNAFLSEPTPQAYEIAEYYHPGWRYLKRGAKKLMARNSHEVLGKDLDDPVDFIVCWTPDGSKDGKSKTCGGTGQALRIAADYELDVFNLALPDDLEGICEVIGADGMPLG